MNGITVMLEELYGENRERTKQALEMSAGKTISAIDLSGDEELTIRFTDSTGIVISDQGQSCCESRYMRTDDDLPYYFGATLLDVELREAPDVQDEHDAHEVQFLVLVTDRGNITFSNHNEHNGYYGGFSIAVKMLEIVQ
jgi:hypothetical protein